MVYSTISVDVFLNFLASLTIALAPSPKLLRISNLWG